MAVPEDQVQETLHATGFEIYWIVLVCYLRNSLNVRNSQEKEKKKNHVDTKIVTTNPVNNYDFQRKYVTLKVVILIVLKTMHLCRCFWCATGICTWSFEAHYL